MTDKNESEIIGETLTGGLSEMAYHQINDNDIEPLVIVRALITVAGNVGGRHTAHMCGRTTSHIIFFCKFFQDSNSTNQSAKADVQLSLVEVGYVPIADSRNIVVSVRERPRLCENTFYWKIA